MTWESRKGRGRYYTRSRRINGKRVRQYVRLGTEAKQAAAEDARAREERQARADTLRAEQERWNALDAVADGFSGALNLLVKASLAAAGYHRHDRGTWRKRR
jgi:hypothetical protein